MKRAAWVVSSSVLLLAARPSAAFPPPTILGRAPEYLVITADELASEFERLAAWKTRTGVPAAVQTLSRIVAGYPSEPDDAARIRRFLQEAQAGGPLRWVLIGGDTEVIPARLARTTFFGGAFIPTDLYYSCLEGDWDADGDGLYGEGYLSAQDPGDDADLTPELFVGRAPVRSAEEARIFVEKTIRYEQHPTADFDRAVLAAAEVLFPASWSPGQPVQLDGAAVAEEVLAHLTGSPGLEATRYYENYADPAWVPGALPETRAAVLGALETGFNAAILVGHGDADSISLADAFLTRADALELANAGRLTNVYASSSLPAALDQDCVGEAFLRAPGGGAVTFIGPTQADFPIASRIYASEFFRLVYRAGVDAVGEALARQRLPFLPFATFDGVHRWTQMSYVLLGDPELHIWTGAPPLQVEYPAGVDLADSAFRVRVTGGGLPRAGARVTAYWPDRELGVAETDDAGTAVVPFHSALPGSFYLTVTAGGSEPYLGTMEVLGTVGRPRDELAGRASLEAPRPNPARASVRLGCSVPAGVAGEPFELAVYDVSGRRVTTLAAGGARAGRTETTWDLRDHDGRPVGGGLYLVRLTLGDRRLARRLLVLK